MAAMGNTAALYASSETEPSFAGSAFLTFFPLVLILVAFFFLLRVMRRTTARAEEALRLSREMVAELRAIRAAVERRGVAREPESPPPSSLSGQTLPTR
jgi:hypothetical protein